MWSDNETTVDFLSVGHLAGAVKRTVLNRSLLPVTVGVFGDWGSGKSSLASIVEAELKSQKDILCIRFNGWLFEDFEDTKTALMGTILDRLIEERGALEKAKDLVPRLWRRINWFRFMRLGAKAAGPIAAAFSGDPAFTAALAGMVGQQLQDFKPEDLENLLKDESKEPVRKAVREFRDDFEEVLKKTDVQTMVVLLDDLDRCLPETLLETLEAVRLFLYTPRTAFIICADERLVRAAVRHRYPQVTECDIPGEYLEKLVQVPIRIPALSPRDVSRYLALLL